MFKVNCHDPILVVTQLIENKISASTVIVSPIHATNNNSPLSIYDLLISYGGRLPRLQWNLFVHSELSAGVRN
jgi:hypothetical protein